jgi:hypothetical protein
MRLLAAAICAALAAAGCAPTPPAATRPTPTATPTATPTLTSRLHQVSDPGTVTGTLRPPCQFRRAGALPDSHCTPGAYDPLVTAAKLCAPGYTTSAYRPPSAATTSFKLREAFPAYGVVPQAAAELDHLVPLELGGANDAANLWPEVGGIPNAKDPVENRLHAWVCAASGAAAQLRLARAQIAIATDWQHAETNLGISQVTPPP